MRIIALLVAALGCFFAVVPGFACCSTEPASFMYTYGWAGELEKDGQLVHLLVYQNIPRNLAVRPSGGPAGNSMILPIPAVSGSMNASNMVDGRDFVGIPEDLARPNDKTILEVVGEFAVPLLPLLLMYSIVLMLPKKFRPLWMFLVVLIIYIVGMMAFTGKASEQSQSFMASLSQLSDQHGVLVFDKGSYTVVLAGNAGAIPEALNRVPENRRPRINREIFDAYDKWYPGWTFALCCFDKDLTNPEPLVWWYKPRNPEQIFFPALDAHTGHAPVLDSMVDVDHHLVVSSHQMFTSLADSVLGPVHRVQLSKPIEAYPQAVQVFLPRYVMGRTYTGKKLQGDFLFNTIDVRLGLFRPYRMSPAGSLSGLLLSWTDIFSEDPSLVVKVALAFLLSSILLLIGAQSYRSGQMLFFAVVLFYLSPELAKLSTESMALFVTANILKIVLVPLCMLVPIHLLVRKKSAIKNRAGLAASILVVCAFALPGDSSIWLPLAWAALFAFSFQYKPGQLQAVSST